jgi:type II secretion system protein J
MIKAVATRRSRSAFTLLEVLTAVAIFSVVVAAINAVFFAALRLRNRAAQATEDLTPTERAISVIKRDLLAAVPPGRTLSGEMTTSPTTMGIGMPLPGTAIEFYTTSGLISDDAPWGDAQKVAFYLRRATAVSGGGGQELIRSVTRNLLATADTLPEEQLLLEDVEQLQFSFFDGNQWRPTWNSNVTATVSSTNQTMMPLAVEVLIQQSELPGRVRPPVRFVVPITTEVLATSSTETNSP